MMLEHELLEQIAEDERDFTFALWVFDGDLARLKSALIYQVGDGLIEIRWANETPELSVSELKAIWCDDENFLNLERAKQYSIRVTDKGAKRSYE